MVNSVVYNGQSNGIYPQEYGNNRHGQYHQTNELIQSATPIQPSIPMQPLSPIESSISMQSSLPVSSSSLTHPSQKMHHPSLPMHPSLQSSSIHTASPMYSMPMQWYTGGYYHPQQLGSTDSSNYINQEKPLWHQHAATHSHNVLQHEFQDYMNSNMSTVQYQQHLLHSHNQVPSPSISEVSSQGSHSGKISPNQCQSLSKPAPARSPFGWMKGSSYQTRPNPGKTRTKDKYRVVYSDNQRIELERDFTFVNKYLTAKKKSDLAAGLGLSERQVKIWFQNRRAKERRQNKKRIEEKSQMCTNGGSYQQQNLLNPPTQMQQHLIMHN